jgi:hypothetical protein
MARDNGAELDPILSLEDMWTDAGMSPATWRRNWRHRLPMIRISARRIGCRRSVWRAALEAETGKLPGQAVQARRGRGSGPSAGRGP